MPFCSKCGNTLNEGAKFCNSCGNVITPDASAQQPAPQAIQQPMQAAPVASSKPSVFNEAIDMIKNYWKNSKDVINTAKEKKSYAAAGILAGAFFIAVLLGYIIFAVAVGRSRSFFGFGAFTVNFPFAILTAIALTVLIAGLYTVILFLSDKLLAKNANTGESFLNAFVTFAIHSIPVSAGFILFGLTSLIFDYLGWLIFAVVAGYLVVTLVSSIKELVPAEKDNTITTLILSAVIGVAAFIVVIVFSNLHNLSIGLGFLDTVGSALDSIF